MPDRTLSPITYIVIDAVLVLFTILTVGLSFLHASGVTHLLSGLLIGLIKATLVVLFFMHAIRSPAQVRAVLCVSIFWLVVVLLTLTLSDYFTRSMIHSMPGH